MKKFNNRQSAIFLLMVFTSLLCAVTAAGIGLEGWAVKTDFSSKNLNPCIAYIFGTDWMGRDMFARTLTGLSLSIRIGALTAAISAVIALILGVSAAVLGERADAVITWFIDLVMGIPHILLVILISLACGKGFIGVTLGVSLSHWPSLARVIRAEVMQFRQAPYVLAAEKMGSSKLKIAGRHMLPLLLPQFLTGLILQFPHAILHEASITFLGFGLSPEQPAIGVILSESMRYLTTGKWWLALFPGIALVLVVMLFAVIGDRLRCLFDPAGIQE